MLTLIYSQILFSKKKTFFPAIFPGVAKGDGGQKKEGKCPHLLFFVPKKERTFTSNRRRDKKGVGVGIRGRALKKFPSSSPGWVERDERWGLGHSTFSYFFRESFFWECDRNATLAFPSLWAHNDCAEIFIWKVANWGGKGRGGGSWWSLPSRKEGEGEKERNPSFSLLLFSKGLGRKGVG